MNVLPNAPPILAAVSAVLSGPGPVSRDRVRACRGKNGGGWGGAFQSARAPHMALSLDFSSSGNNNKTPGVPLPRACPGDQGKAGGLYEVW